MNVNTTLAFFMEKALLILNVFPGMLLHNFFFVKGLWGVQPFFLVFFLHIFCRGKVLGCLIFLFSVNFDAMLFVVERFWEFKPFPGMLCKTIFCGQMFVILRFFCECYCEALFCGKVF